MKRIAANFPAANQQGLKRVYFSRQIKRGNFRATEPEFDQLSEWVSEGDWVLDVGANIGHYASELSQLVGATGRVIAFEPVFETFELLVANAAHFRYRNVTLINAASTDAPALLGMSIPKFDTGASNYYQANISEANTDTEVFCFPIDALSIPHRVSLVKMDVEGHEFQALTGMSALIRRDGPRLIIEGNSPRVASMLSEHGYKYEKLRGSPNRVYTKPQTD